MAERGTESNGNNDSCQTCENERVDNNIKSTRFESVELNAVDGDISDISDEEGTSGAGSTTTKSRPKKKLKKKRRSKSFTSNDENTSTDDDTVAVVSIRRQNAQDVNLADLSWTMWMWYYVVAVSTGAFHFAEYCGEKLAEFFGITTPKYQYVIDEYYRVKQEEKEEKEQEEREKKHIQQVEAEKLSNLEGGDKTEITHNLELNQI
eukprot:gene20185-22160_t